MRRQSGWGAGGGGCLSSSGEDSAGLLGCLTGSSCPSQEQQPSPLHVLKEAQPSHAAWLIPTNRL